MDEDIELKYDGLIVYISGHGIEDHIITSDWKAIQKSVLHGIISMYNPKLRKISGWIHMMVMEKRMMIKLKDILDWT